MEQVIQAEQSRSKRYTAWLGMVLALLGIAGAAVWGGGLFVWAAGALLAAPLTVLASVALFTLPGAALLRLLGNDTLEPAEYWSMAVAASCAVIPLLLLLSAPFGPRWSTPLCWAWLGICALVAAWPGGGRAGRPARLPAESWLLLAITLLALAARLFPARDLPVGPWGDSYHHTIIARLLVQNGGLFSSWQPYAPLTTFTYHYGFHSLVAWLVWLSGIPPTAGLLVVGQVQSALAAPMVYLLARRIGGSSAAGLWAAVIVGFVSAMPAYFLNWGRYTQLAGQTILPAACVAWMLLLEQRTESREQRTENREQRTEDRGMALARRFSFRNLQPSTFNLQLGRPALLAGLLMAGLTVTHYRVAVFLGCFVAVYGIYVLLARVRSWGAWARLALAGAAAGGLAAALAAPWLIRLRDGSLLKIGSFMMSRNLGGGDVRNGLPPQAEILALHLKPYLLALAALGLGLLLWRRQWRALVLPAAAALIWLAANPFLLGLNGAGIVNNFTVLLAAYLLLAPLAGAALALGFELAGGLAERNKEQRTKPALSVACPEQSRRAEGNKEQRTRNNRRASVSLFSVLCSLFSVLQFVAAALVIIWGLGWQQRIAAPQFQIFTPADARAMAWIADATPPGAAFYVNSSPAYAGTLFVGTDGGWWIPYMTGRPSNLPPVVYGSEAAESPGYGRDVNTQNMTINQLLRASPDAAAAALQAAGYAYLYDGPAANPPDEAVSTAALARSPRFELLYNQDGASIWRVR